MNQHAGNIRSTLGPLQVVMLFVFALTIAGGSLLLSAAESEEPVDGALPWREDSTLRAVVKVLCLGYEFPTAHPDDVKSYVLGIGAGISLLALAGAVLGRRGGDELRNTSEKNSLSRIEGAEGGLVHHKIHIAPLYAAQVLVGFYLLWSFASSRWSAAPDLAIGGSILLGIQLLFAFCLGHGLNRAAVHIALRVLISVTLVKSLFAVWYFYGRNPTIRAKFPFGNPTFLSACLIPGILASICLLPACFTPSNVSGLSRRGIWAVLAISNLAFAGWAFYLADSRGSAMGLAVGVVAAVFFAVRGKGRWISGAAAVVLLIIGAAYLWSIRTAPSPTGRDATARLRTYAWKYAWDMFREKPFTGFGQGGYVLSGDAHAVQDVLNDPLVFTARLTHAHNEWLEVLADLGAVGFVLIAAALVLTVRAGMLVLDDPGRRADRAAMVALLSALVAIAVSESFGVGLRISGVPTYFWGILGLVWSLAGPATGSPLVGNVSQKPGYRVLFGIVAGTMGVATLMISHGDFSEARRGFSAEEHLTRGDFDQALSDASAPSRLNPQRVLEGYYRLAECYLLVARKLQERADSREVRAHEQDPPDNVKLALAYQDRMAGDEQCQLGSGVLKELVKRSPAYLNQGWLDYGLNVVQAENAEARGDVKNRNLFLASAKAALERELARQPFEPKIATPYAYLCLSTGHLTSGVNAVARAIRYHRIQNPEMDFLAAVHSDETARAQFLEMVREGWSTLVARSTPPAQEGPTDLSNTLEIWGAEKLRLLAARRIVERDYEAAREALEIAARFYEGISEKAALGAASCFAELADARFRHRPDLPAEALAAARRTMEIAPKSEPGRALAAEVDLREVNYLLAARREGAARSRLLVSAPPGVTDELLSQQLALHYRRMVEAVVFARTGGIASEDSGPAVLDVARSWIARSIELNGIDPTTFYLDAVLSIHGNDCARAAERLREALRLGLPSEHMEDFVVTTYHQQPDCPGLADLLDLLGPTVGPPFPEDPAAILLQEH